MIFSYTGIDKTGKEVSGNIESPDRITAARKLRARGIKVKRITKEDPTRAKKVKKIKPMILMMITRQLSTLLKAGVPILAAVQSIASQIDDESLKEIMENIETGIKNGLSLSKSLALQRGAFSDLYVNIVYAGETGGVLPEVLERLANFIEKDERIRAEVKSALRYPFMVIGAIILAFLFLVRFVVPKFSMMFKQFNIELPLPTRILIGLSDFLEKYWMWLIVFVVGLIFAFVKYKKTPQGKRKIDEIMLKIPVMGDLIIKFNMTRFANILATLIKSGVPIVSCLTIVRNVIDNELIKEDVDKIIKSVEAGQGIHKVMNESKLFPKLMTNMVEIGEKSGAVDEMLIMVSNHYEMETHYAVKALTSLIEPLMTVTTGALVLGLALAIFLPMWDIVKAARK